MLNYSLLENIFSSRIAFRQARNECTPKIHPSLLTGRVFVDAVRDAKVYLQPDTVFENVTELSKTSYIGVNDWVITSSYSVGQRVYHDNGDNRWVYYCISDTVVGNPLHTPAFDSSFWETDLSRYLREARKDSINEALASVIIENNTDKYLRSVMQFANYFEERSPYTDFSSTEFRLRYLKLSLGTNRHLNLTINKLGIKTDTAQTLTFYLFHSSQPNAITQFDIDLQVGFNWYTLDQPLELSYLSNNNSKGVFMLGFYENDVVGNIQITNLHRKNIGNDNHLFSATFANSIGADQLDLTKIPELEAGYQSLTDWDNQAYFNFQYSIGLDYTYAVEQAPQVFDKFIQYDTALRILLDSRNSLLANTNKAHLMQRFDFILNDGYVENGQFHKKSQIGLSGELDKLKEGLKINLNYQGGSPFDIHFR